MDSSLSPRAAAAAAIASTMATLHHLAPEGLPPELQAAWDNQEKLALSLIKGTEISEPHKRVEVLSSRSYDLLEALSDLPDPNDRSRVFHEDLIKRVLTWITPRHMELAISKGLIPTQEPHLLIDHKPDDPDWDALVTGPFSRAALGSSSRRDLGDFLGVSGIIKRQNIKRCCAYARTQVRHHPELLRNRLEENLEMDAWKHGDPPSRRALKTILLIAAGVSTDGIEEQLDSQITSAFRKAPSSHERMRLMGLRNSLEDTIVQIQKQFTDP